LRKNKHSNQGFTLIEVLISIVILSLIAVITSNFLKSSIQSRDFVSVKSKEIYEFNLLTNTLNEKATFIGGANTDSFSFITKAITQDISSKDLVRVEYVLENQSLVRRQYYAASPANPLEYMETMLYEDVGNLQLEFADKTQWYYAWPQGPITQRQIPNLIKVSITNKQNESFVWVVNPSINTIYE